MKNVGYMLNTKEEGFTGEAGLFYSYILGSNGLFFHAQNKHLEAIIPISEVAVRGLAPIDRDIVLLHGRVPRDLYELALSIMWARHEKENELLIVWGSDGKYHVIEPMQEGKEAHVGYSIVADTVIDMHNHTGGSSFFSSTDNNDDQGFKISMVLANIEEMEAKATYVMRLCAYGYFCEMDFEEVFE